MLSRTIHHIYRIIQSVICRLVVFRTGKETIMPNNRIVFTHGQSVISVTPSLLYIESQHIGRITSFLFCRVSFIIRMRSHIVQSKFIQTIPPEIRFITAYSIGCFKQIYRIHLYDTFINRITTAIMRFQAVIIYTGINQFLTTP